MFHRFKPNTVELSALIVHRNGERFKKLLEKHSSLPPSIPYDVIVVDNASADDTVEWLHSDETQAVFGDSGVGCPPELRESQLQCG